MASVLASLVALALLRPAIANSTIPLPSFASDSYHASTPLGSLILHNGTIHTQNPRQPLASVLAISNGLITYVGTNLTHALSLPFASPPLTINLQNRTTIPGLIDCHNHLVLLGNRPGHHTPLEHTPSIASLQQTYLHRTATVPPGKFITTLGGFHPNQFRERRLPTLSELDAVTPSHPVFISTGFSGPATTNSLGRSIFSSYNVSVAANGSIAAGLENGKALLALRGNFTFDDRKESVLAAMRHAVGVGVTTHLDQGAFPASGTAADGIANEDLEKFHLPFLKIYEEGRGLVRLRINFLHMDGANGTGVANRLGNTFPFFGNSMVRTGAIGEFHVAEYDGGAVFEASAKKIAAAGWRLEVHSLTGTDFMGQVRGFEAVDREVGIKGLRWVIAHVPRITGEYLGRLKALGGGVNLSGWNYLAGTGNETNPAGPPFGRILESGIPAGFGADGANIAPLSPWPHFYYAVTGKNAKGEVINPGQTVSRQDVLRWYTRDNTWFLGGPDEKSLGVLEVGRLGDVVVLSDDLFEVEEEKLKSLTSVLTVLGGAVVHDGGALKR